MTRPGRVSLLAAALVTTAALAAGLGTTDFLPPDEARVAEVAREMGGGDGWLVPRLNGRPFLEEPPLFYWLQSVCFRVAGAPSTLVARIPAAAAAIAGVAVSARLALVLGADACLVALVLATSPEWWWMARSATPDAAAAAATGLAMLLFFEAWRSGRRTMLAGGVAALGVAFWCKSYLPVGLGVVATGAFLAMAGRGRLSWRDVAWAVAGMALASGVWIAVVAWGLGGPAVAFFIVANHVDRLLGQGDAGHVRSALYYPMNLALDLFPWSVVLPTASIAAWRARLAPERLFPLVWAVAMTVALSVSATKRAHYLLPAYPAFALLVAQWWLASSDRVGAARMRRVLVCVVAIAAPVATFLLLAVDPVRATAAEKATVSTLLAAVAPTPSAWLGGVAVATLGALALSAERRAHPARLAACLGVLLTAVHLVVVHATLPAIGAITSARPWAERLAHLTDGGTPVVVFGFRESEQLSPFMFYARRRFETFDDLDALAHRLERAPACVLFRGKDYEDAARVVGGTPVARDMVGGMQLVLVETSPGLCGAERGRRV